MTDLFDPPIIVDTNVVFEGLTKQGSASDLIVTAWLAGLLNVYASNALLYEYESILSTNCLQCVGGKLNPSYAEC